MFSTELEEMSNKELQKLEDEINEIQKDRLIDAIKGGVIKFKESKTFMEWWRS
jgi:hypothetical protein